MKAARLQAYGDADQFRYEDAPNPVAARGEVVITVAASGLNPVDAYIRQGYLAKMVPMQLPAIMGIDAAGTIAAVGPGVGGFKIGDRVIAHLPINGHGGHAELAPGAAGRSCQATRRCELCGRRDAAARWTDRSPSG